MITRNAPKNSWVKKLVTIPLLLGVVILFSTSTHAQQTDGAVYTDRMVKGTEKLGANPYVLIGDKPYPSDVLTRISPDCIAATVIYNDTVILTLNEKGLTYATAIQRENLALERAAKNGFYYRLRLKHDDGTPYDRLIINAENGQTTTDGKPDCKVAFIVDDKLYTEGQLYELQTRIKTMHIAESGAGYVPKAIPGVDLSDYEVKFFFYSTPLTSTLTN